MSQPALRRFYKQATSVPCGQGHRIELDGKALHSPAKHELILPGRALAAAIAEEWARQGEKLAPHTMSLMQLAATAIDRVAPERPRVVDEVVGYAGTDLVCYRAAEPPALAVRQAQAWDPLIDWLRRRYDVSLVATTGIVAVAQPEATLEALRRVVAGMDHFTLAALASMTGAAGSLVIALALAGGEITPEEAAHAAQLDELFQAERWGEDKEAIDRRVAQLGDLVAAKRFLDLLAAG
ncbi:chaperone required for assembly of F1-ATPase [Dongia mobilis]|uniref:Chaperone required for assembly of F1-ATPase n=1 Tax=Dongia mobilis TaxID=578943 RepID=A0A4R6WUJ6_9PROT|nr:ATP12 family protein [Dongia mobilis]TDQ83810.1 chaperone required for assembly of F1-ATPase [Dongia mobilis]